MIQPPQALSTPSAELVKRYSVPRILPGAPSRCRALGVGHRLCELLAQAGARVFVADIEPSTAARVGRETGATVVSASEIVTTQADILAPCALGGVLSSDTIPKLRVKAVCGCANNQLATSEDGDLLFAREIAFVPDYVVSAGGVIGGALEMGVIDDEGYEQRMGNIYDTTVRVLKESQQTNIAPSRVAQSLAEVPFGPLTNS